MNRYPYQSVASRSLPHNAYRMGTYVGDDVKVVILLQGDDDGSMPEFADKWMLDDESADLAGLLGFPYVDTSQWDFGCDGRAFSSSVAAVGFIDDMDYKHLNEFAKNHPDLRITVSYESNRYNGVRGYRNGKPDNYGRHTVNRWICAETGSKELSYAEFVAIAGERDW